MREYGSRFDREALEGLIRALVHAARAGEEDLPYTVVTTAPSLWLPYCSSEDVTLLDISGIVGPTLWWNEADARDRTLSKFRALGWPDSSLVLEYRVAEASERQTSIRADLVLTNEKGHPVAVVEIARPGPLAKFAPEHARLIAQVMNVRHAFVTDGARIFRCSLDDSNALVESPFPTLKELGIGTISDNDDSGQTVSVSARVVSCDTVEAFLEALVQQAHSAVIVDFTLPWGMFERPELNRMRRSLPDSLQSVKFKEASAVVIGVVASQSVGRRFVAVMPPGIARASLYSRFRGHIAERSGLAGVIQLPALPLMFDTPVTPLIIVLGDYPIRVFSRTVFIKLTNRGDIVEPDTAIWWTALSDGLQGKRMSTGFTASTPLEQPWTSIEEQREVHAAVEKLRGIAETVPLGDLCTVFIGFGHQPLDEAKIGTGVPVIRGHNLSSAELTKEDLQWVKSDKPIPEQYAVRRGDILIQRLGTSPKCLVAGLELEGAIASNTVYVARPKDPRAYPRMICQFLCSTAGQHLLTINSQSSVVPTLPLSTLQNVPIPLLPPDTVRDLEELEQVESELRSHADKIAALRLGLYSVESQQELRHRLSEYRLLATALSSSLKQAETLSFQVHNFYPFPLAYSYRLIGSRIGTESLYKIQMRVVENLLAFLGSLTLGLLESNEHITVRDPNPKFSDKLILQSYWEGGISPGHWRDICSRGAVALSTYHDNELALALGNLWRKGSAFADRIKQLIETKNDFKHDREPDDEISIQQASIEAQTHLDAVMRELAFLTRFPISLVRDLDTPRGTRTVILRTLDYIGDHPEHPSGRYEYSMPLTKNDLYIQARPDMWVPLYPFLTVQTCPHCKARETYFIDKWLVSKQEAHLKSFERAHQECSEDVAKTLSEW